MIKLVHGDCLEILELYPPGSFECVVTSPIYNLGIKYRSGCDDKIPRPEYLKFTFAWLTAVHRVMTDAASLFLNINGKPTDPWGPFEVAMVAREVFKLQNKIHWIKSYSLDGEAARGHAKPLQSKRFVTDCGELILHLTKTGEVELDKLAVGVPFADVSNLVRGGRGANGNLRNPGNCVGERIGDPAFWQPYETIQSREKDRPHPATYPPRLAEYCFRLHGLSRIKTTLDPFSGLGATARASKKLGLSHVGIELGAEDVADAERLLATVREERP